MAWSSAWPKLVQRIKSIYTWVRSLVFQSNLIVEEFELVSHFNSLSILGLIAEYIRRHHYRESVQVLCQYMPILDGAESEEGGAEDDNQTESDESEEDPEELPNGENGANGSAANEAANNLR